MYVYTQDKLAKVFIYDWEVKIDRDHEDPIYMIRGREDISSPFILLGTYSSFVRAQIIADNDMVVANLSGLDYTMPQDYYVPKK